MSDEFENPKDRTRPDYCGLCDGFHDEPLICEAQGFTSFKELLEFELRCAKGEAN